MISKECALVALWTCLFLSSVFPCRSESQFNLGSSRQSWYSSNTNRALRGGDSLSLHTSDHNYVDRYKTCFGCRIALSTSVQNKHLYDTASLPAMFSAISRLMGESEDSIIYDRDPSKLCLYAGMKNENDLYIAKI